MNFEYAKLAKNLKISKLIIYFKTNIVYAQYITLVVLTLLEFQGLSKTFGDRLGVLTMYQVIPRVFLQATMNLFSQNYGFEA